MALIELLGSDLLLVKALPELGGRAGSAIPDDLLFFEGSLAQATGPKPVSEHAHAFGSRTLDSLVNLLQADGSSWGRAHDDLSSRWGMQAFFYGGAFDKLGQYALHLVKGLELNQRPGLIKLYQVFNPGKNGDISNGVLRTHDPVLVLQMLIQHGEQPFGLIQIAVAGTLVLKVLASEFMEKPYLSKHGTNAAHLKHEPLQCVIALHRISR